MKAKLTALLLGILFLFPLTYAIAQTDGTADTVPLESPSCDEILEKIDTKIMNYELNQAIHVETYQMLYVKVDAAVKRAKVMGYNTDEIEADLVELDILTTQFQDSFETFITNIKQTREYSCTENDDIRYAQSFISTQKSLGEVRDVAAEISLLYENEIREHLLGLSLVERVVENE